MNEEISWRKNGYKMKRDIEIRPEMAPNQTSCLRGDVFVNDDGDAFSCSKSSVYFGKMNEENIMVYDDSYISGGYGNDLRHMTNLFKDYGKNGKSLFKSDEQIRDFSVYFIKKIIEED